MELYPKIKRALSEGAKIWIESSGIFISTTIKLRDGSYKTSNSDAVHEDFSTNMQGLEDILEEPQQ